MKIVVIAAHSMDHTIGRDGKIPWHISADLKRFKDLTKGHVVIMGRKTFESIGKPLPLRHNIVITRDRNRLLPILARLDSKQEELLSVAYSYDEAIERAKEMKFTKCFIIGGEEVYMRGLYDADELQITLVFDYVAGDAHFPMYTCKDWDLESASNFKGQDSPDYGFLVFKRKLDVFRRILKFLRIK